MHTCLKDPDKAPDIARRSYLMIKRLMPQAKIIDPSVASSSNCTAATPRPLHYKLLPTHTVRRQLRVPFRISTGKCTMYAQTHRRLRETSYKPLPEGWQWPRVPDYRNLPYHKPKKKRKKRIPQEVLDEWRLFNKRTQASSSSSSSSASPSQPSWLMEARDPGTGPLDSEARMGEDSAEEEAFTCLDPFEHDWDEMELGLDDPH